MDSLPPPPADYIYLNLSSNVLGINSSGTDVILARFPESGGLGTFGLTPSAIKTLAIPNNLKAWPEDALSGCSALESITVHEPEVCVPFLTVVQAHFDDCTSLKHIQFPSTVEVGDEAFSSHSSLQCVVFPASTRVIGYSAFYLCGKLTVADLSSCNKTKYLLSKKYFSPSICFLTLN